MTLVKTKAGKVENLMSVDVSACAAPCSQEDSLAQKKPQKCFLFATKEGNTLCVGPNARPGHCLRHSDTCGPCSVPVGEASAPGAEPDTANDGNENGNSGNNTVTGMATTATMELKTTAAEVQIAGMEVIHPRTPTLVAMEMAMETTVIKIAQMRTKPKAENNSNAGGNGIGDDNPDDEDPDDGNTTGLAQPRIPTRAVMVMTMQLEATATPTKTAKTKIAAVMAAYSAVLLLASVVLPRCIRCWRLSYGRAKPSI
jgi:hypothetical protein